MRSMSSLSTARTRVSCRQKISGRPHAACSSENGAPAPPFAVLGPRCGTRFSTFHDTTVSGGGDGIARAS
jgi:hypothetical protein